MKLIAFFSLIVVTLIVSLAFTRKGSKSKPSSPIIRVITINLLILGAGSIWWFLTETDGISQGIGIWIYFGAFVTITLIDIIYIWSWRKPARN